MRTSIFILLAGVCLTGCDGGKSSAPNSGQSPSSGSPLTAPADYLGAAARAQQSAGKVVSQAGITKAIQLFEGQEGRHPKSLAELVPKYLDKIPSPPAGMKFAYNPADGSLKVVPQ